MDWTPLARHVEALSAGANIAVSARVVGGSEWHYRGDESVAAASTAKIPIMVEIFRCIDRGSMSLGDMHEVAPSEKSAGSGVLRYLHDGLPLSVADLLYLMIAISDNTATNILIRAAGMDRINQTMSGLGMHGSVLGRPMVGRLAIAGEQENLATACDYTRLLDAIFNGIAATPASCAAMLELLEKQQNPRRVGAAVPRGPGFRWGAKNGTNEGIVNEVGFVTTPVGTLLIAVYTQGVSDEIAGEAIIAALTASALQCAALIPN